MDQQSKQGPGQGHGKRKKDDETAAGGNGASNGHDEFPADLAASAKAAFEAEKQSVEKGIDAWKKLVASNQTAWAPRRELARVYKKAERWNAFIEVMKEAVDKANWSSPEDKIPVLREMIEVYRDRLKLDVMVVNAFTQILNIQPTNFEATDELAAQYETMKRWPDLISLLRKKASVVETPAEKVALQLRIANLFLEKFSNQAEAIKAFEAILEIDPENADALTFVKQMYEKRRDWEKLVAVHQREIEKITDDDVRRARRVEVAKLASEKMKKASVSIELWQKVLADDPAERRGARRAGEAVRAREDVERARRRAGAAGGGGVGRHPALGDLREAGRALHREGPERRAGDGGLAGAAAGGAGQPARAGRAQEALSPAEGLERPRGVLRRAGEVGRAGARPRAPGGVRGRGRARRPLEQDRRALSRSSAEGRPRAEGLREGAVVRRQEPAGGRGADPALREGQGRQAPRRGAVRRARTHEGSGGAAGASQAARRAARSGRGRQGRGAARGADRARRGAHRQLGDRDLPPPGRRGARVGRAGFRPTRRRCRVRHQGRDGAAGAARHAGRGVRIGARQPRAGHRAQSADHRASAQEPRGGGGARAPLRRHRALRRSARRLRQEAGAGQEQGRGALDPLQAGGPLRRRDQAARQGGAALSGDPQAGSQADARRWRRSIASTSSSDAGKSWRRRSKRRSTSPPTWPRSPS